MRSLPRGFEPVGHGDLPSGHLGGITTALPDALLGGWTVLGGDSMRVRGVVGFDLVLLGPELMQDGKIALSTSGCDWTVSFPCR